MSIFESKEFWSTSVSKNKEEEFDRNSISTGIIEQSQKTCVSVGSFSGNLRIYTPSFGDNSSNTLKFSKKFEEPILQTEIGNFTRANNNIDQLAILLIHRLFVIKFKDFKPGNNSIEFEHKLKRNGHNLTKARVGDKNYDIIFVQSIDGAISIYEGENFINMVVLSEVYFPGQMGYLNTKDSLVISNTAYEIECYSFNSLATLKNDNSSQIVKQFNHIWKVNLGELSTQIQIVFNKINKREEIVVLTETLLNLINSNGTLLYQKKLDFEPMCFYAYNITDDNYIIKNQIFDLMCLISSTYHHIMIYKGFQLAWVAKVFDTPIYISLNNFENIQSLIVTLNDFGNLNVLYLGMEKIKNMKLIKTKDIDPKKMVKEREKLTQIINSYEKGIFINDKENALKINALVHKEIFYVKGRDDNKVFHKDNYGKILESLVQLEFEYGSQEANDIHVNIICPYNIICDDPIFVIPSLGSNSNNNIKKNLKFRVIEQYYPTFITIDVYTSYYAIEKNEKIIKSSSISFELPLGLFVKVENEAKSNLKFSITLETDKPSMKLNDIFDDLDQSFPDYDLIKNKSNSVLFVYPNKKEVAVNLGKAKGTYSIESDNFESILFILNQIVYRLKEKYKDINYWINDKFKVKDYFFRVKEHYELIQKKKDLLKNLEKYTSLYTNLQKNLLNKYQKKTPPKLANIDFFLKNVYKDIVAESDLVQKTNNEIKSLYRDIYIWTESIIYLTKLRARLNDEEYQLLKSVFPLDNINNNENNWEDITYYNMINLDLYYFEEKEKLKEISGNIDFDQWEKEFRNILSSILTRKGIFNKQKLNNSSNISESSNVKNSTNND